MTSSGSTAIRFCTSCTPMTAGSSRRPSRATARCPRSFAWPTSVARPCPCGSAPSATRTAAATGRSAMPWACSSTLTKVSGKRNLRARLVLGVAEVFRAWMLRRCGLVPTAPFFACGDCAVCLRGGGLAGHGAGFAVCFVPRRKERACKSVHLFAFRAKPAHSLVY